MPGQFEADHIAGYSNEQLFSFIEWYLFDSQKSNVGIEARRK